MSKLIVYVIKPDNSCIKRKIKNPKETIEIQGKTYLMDRSCIVSLKKQRLIFYSENAIFPINAEEKSNAEKVTRIADLKLSGKTFNYESTNADNQFQILLHTKALKDFLKVEQENLMTYLLIAGAGVLLGMIMGLIIGHATL